MKIYKRVVLSIETGEIIDEDSFEYSGQIALCGGDTKTIGSTIFDPLNLSGVRTPDTPDAPGKTSAEQKLDQQQINLLQIQIENSQKQQKLQEEFEPFQLEAMGYKRDINGKIQKIVKAPEPPTPQDILLNKQLAMAGFSPTGEKLTEQQMIDQMSESEKADYELTNISRQRQKDAIEGKIPISPALEEELASEEKQATEMLSRKLGPNWMLTTPGQKAMVSLKQKAELLREEARRGQITSGEGILASRTNQENLKSNMLSGISGTIGLAADIKNNTLNQKTSELSRMQGYVSSLGGGNAFDNSLSLSSKYASERANTQNLAMQKWTTQQNQQSSNTSAGMAAAAAAAA